MKKALFMLLLLRSFNSFSQVTSDTTATSYDNSHSKDDFQFVTEFKSGNKVYVMVEERKYNSILLWVKYVHPQKPVKDKKGKVKTSGGNYELLHIELYCDERTYDLEKGLKYNAKGDVLDSTDLPQHNVSIIPETLFDYVKKYICN